MAEELARVILDTLKDYDYIRKSPKAIAKLAGCEAYGLMSPNSHKIWVSTKLSHEDLTVTQLHEIAHAYLHTINKFKVPEKEVDRLAYEWKQRMDGVYK